MKVALDTNVLAYAAGVNDQARQDRAQRLINAMDAADIVLPSQVAGELYTVLHRKDRRSREDAAAIVQSWIDILVLAVHSPTTFADALNLARDHEFQLWDALVVCVSAEAGCALLLSEDMHEGFVYRGMTIANPFADPLHPVLASSFKPLLENP